MSENNILYHNPNTPVDQIDPTNPTLRQKSNLNQKSISFIGSSILNKLSNDLKILDTAASFSHNYL